VRNPCPYGAPLSFTAVRGSLDLVLTDIIQHTEPGLEPLVDAIQVVALLILGHETTTNLVGNGLRILLESRERWQVICQHPEQIPQTIEEILRYDSPVQTVFRTAAHAVEVGGVNIPEGALLLLVYASASRDETKFSHADLFDPQRISTHFCRVVELVCESVT
jgi:cytochrome P450